ncbi:MAG TPA: hypothetical protein VM285_05605 [Polyangia bacterium]|nr:hypothetical protein [Polyangia bacterium]
MDPIVESWTFPFERSLREDYLKGNLESWDTRFKEEVPLFFDAAGAWFFEHQGKLRQRDDPRTAAPPQR